jgi:hypothetical protein
MDAQPGVGNQRQVSPAPEKKCLGGEAATDVFRFMGAFVLVAPAAYRRSWLENGVSGKPTRSLAEINRLLLMVARLND